MRKDLKSNLYYFNVLHTGEPNTRRKDQQSAGPYILEILRISSCSSMTMQYVVKSDVKWINQ